MWVKCQIQPKMPFHVRSHIISTDSLTQAVLKTDEYTPDADLQWLKEFSIDIQVTSVQNQSHNIKLIVKICNNTKLTLFFISWSSLSAAKWIHSHTHTLSFFTKHAQTHRGTQGQATVAGEQAFLWDCRS